MKAIPFVIFVPENPFTMTLYLRDCGLKKNESFDFDPGFFLPIIADDHHAEDGAYAGDGACEGIDVTPELAPPFIGNQYI